MHKRRGLVNLVFSQEADQIEEYNLSSSNSDINSSDFQNNSNIENNLKSVSSDDLVKSNNEQNKKDQMEIPQNLIRRWSQNIVKLRKPNTSTNHNYLNLPSRKFYTIDGQLITATSELEVDEITSQIEQNEELMQDNQTGESLRIEVIRSLPHSLTTKIKVKEKLSSSISRNSQNKSKTIFEYLIHRPKSIKRYLSKQIRSIFHTFEIWYDSIKEIEGHFGSSVSTYFQFLRWLFMLNLILMLFTLSFIVIPQLLYKVVQNDTVLHKHEVNNKTFKVLDFFTGEGYLRKTILFYGAYTNETIKITSLNYSLPQAYFLTMLCLFIFTFIIVSMSMARSYRRSFIEASGEVDNLICQKIFCSWDFKISNEKSSEIKHANIYHKLKEILMEINRVKKEMTKLQKFWIFCSRLSAHMLVFGILFAVGVGMWILLQNFGEENELSPWQSLYMAIAVNFTILILQKFFFWITRAEDYSTPRKALHITLFRNFLLEIVIVCVLICFWLERNKKACWETSVGQEIYRLIIADFFISVLGTSLIQCVYVFIISKMFPSLDKPEFDISEKSLGLVFNQTLLWVGLLFSPLLPIVVIIKMILTFYLKKLTLLNLCKSSTEMWRSTQTQTIYLIITFLSLLGVFVIHGYIMTQVQVSQICGPFRGNLYMFQIFINDVLELEEHNIIWRIIRNFTRPAVMGGVLLTMAVAVYYLRSKSNARIAMVKLLKDMLHMEIKDKEFLLWKMALVTHGKDEIFNFNFNKNERSKYRPKKERTVNKVF